MDYENVNIEIPVGMQICESGHVVLFNTDETDKIIDDIGIVVQGDTLQEAKEAYLNCLKAHNGWHQQRSEELNLWKPFQKGDWKHIGGKWITIFGFHFYFRYGKQNLHGWFVPFTKLNISFTNYWRKKYRHTTKP